MKNVIVIMVDALRFDCIAEYPAQGRDYINLRKGYTTPTMTNMVRKGKVFANCWTTHPYTSGVCGSLATAKFPYNLNGAFNFVDSELDPSIPTIAELLRKSGVVTKHHFDFKPFSDLYGLDRGVDHIHYWDTESDMEIVEWCAEQQKPYYMLWHIGDVHSPYLQSWNDPHQNDFYKGFMSAVADEFDLETDYSSESFWDMAAHKIYPLWKKDNPNRLIRLYLDGVMRFDQNRFARIWKWLNIANVLDDTLIVLLADHGEEFVHGYAAHGDSLREDLLRVPLVLYHQWVKPEVEDSLVRIVDVPATILDVFGISHPGLDGVSLLNDVPPHLCAYAERMKPFMCEYDPHKPAQVVEQTIRQGNRKAVLGGNNPGCFEIRGLTEKKHSRPWAPLIKKLSVINRNRVIAPTIKQKAKEEVDDIMSRLGELGYV